MKAFPLFQAKVTSIVLCQQKKWGVGFLFQVFKRKDREHDSVNAGVITEYTHRTCPPAHFTESSLNGVSGT
jgi:hypothetical protein